jgi:hypothetical protein
MCQAAYQIINPGKKYVLKYTTMQELMDWRTRSQPKQWLAIV